MSNNTTKKTRTDVRNTRTGRYTEKSKAETDKRATVTETRSAEKMVPAVEAEAMMEEARREIEQLRNDETYAEKWCFEAHRLMNEAGVEAQDDGGIYFSVPERVKMLIEERDTFHAHSVENAQMLASTHERITNYATSNPDSRLFLQGLAREIGEVLPVPNSAPETERLKQQVAELAGDNAQSIPVENG